MLSAADKDLGRVRRQFGDWGLSASWLAPTKNALDKHVIDAIAPLRGFLKERGIHDYGAQGRGERNKVVLPAILVWSDRAEKTTISLYRPPNGNGDPRLWIPGLDSYVRPRNVVGVVPTVQGLAIVNVSDASVVDSANVEGSPLSTLIDQEQVAAIERDGSISTTEKEQLVWARVGQGKYRRELERLEKRCRVTGISATPHLRASHIKPWKSSSNREKLDPANGLLLAPHIDHLFDQGYIAFEGNGDLLISPSLDLDVARRLNVPRVLNVGAFSLAQCAYLAYHRASIFKRR